MTGFIATSVETSFFIPPTASKIHWQTAPLPPLQSKTNGIYKKMGKMRPDVGEKH